MVALGIRVRYGLRPLVGGIKLPIGSLAIYSRFRLVWRWWYSSEHSDGISRGISLLFAREHEQAKTPFNSLDRGAKYQLAQCVGAGLHD